jgi:hypothetical protein
MLFFLLARATLSRLHQVLVSVDPNSQVSTRFSLFLNDLSSLEANLTYLPCDSTVVQLERFGERVYDTVVILGKKSACFGQGAEELIHFLDNGGNAFVFASTPPGDVHEKLYRHFGLRVISSAALSDILGNSEVILRNFLAPKAIVSRPPGPLVYEGGFGTIERPNDFRIPIISAGLEHVFRATERVVSNPVHGYDMIPIYALQGRTGGRVVFVHSVTFATDDVLGAAVSHDALLRPIETGDGNGNRELLRELSEYVTHWKSHARLANVTHFATATGVAPVQYHVRQNVTVVADLESIASGEWVPDVGELQVEIFMLGTFIRRHMKRVRPGHFEETLTLPDRAGNFKIKVFTAREGWFNAREEMAIAIRPLAIREKEKFLDCARPYQASMALVMAAAFLAAVHFLYHRPTE